MTTNKQTAYRRGKYKPRKDKKGPREGSLRWWMAQGLTQYQARKKIKSNT